MKESIYVIYVILKWQHAAHILSFLKGAENTDILMSCKIHYLMKLFTFLTYVFFF